MSQSGKYPSAYSAPSAPPAWQQQHQHQPGYGQGSPYSYSQPPTSSPYSQPPASSPYSQPPTSSPYSQPNSSSYGQTYNPYSASPGSGSTPTPHSPYAYPPQGGYGAQYPPQSPFPPGTDPDIVRAFQAADRDGSGLVDEFELQKVLSVGKPFSLRTVRLMILMYGPRDARKIGPKEFATLWKALRDWKVIFERFDRDRSGSIDKSEMREALLSLGYAISAPILDCLLHKYDQTGQAKAMDYDSFVECGLLVKGLTERFKEQDTQLTGSATLNYQTFMLMVLPFIVA